MIRSEHPILVVDDEKNIRRTLLMVLEGEGAEVVVAATRSEAEAVLREQSMDAVLLDVKLGEDNGIELLEALVGRAGPNQDVPVVMISGNATLDDAVRATRLGAFDFLEKPLDRERVIVVVRNALERRRMGREVKQLRERVAGRHEMIGDSPVMRELFAQIAKVAPTRGRVLVTGESGTGKELIARAIHGGWAEVQEGVRPEDVPFVKVNCAAIPPELIESELFGHEKGAFTGATSRKRGLFEVASGGTIFMDEVGDMSLSAQAKVLRVLQNGELVSVGGESVIHVDCRVIAATNKNLEHEVEEGTFREDLYFRLNVIPLHCPPLRDRRQDIAALADSFVVASCEENGFRPKRLAPEVTQRLERYHFPGNIRELRNIIERLVILSGDTIEVTDLPPFLGGTGPSVRAPSMGPQGPRDPGDSLGRYLDLGIKEFRDEVERDYLRIKLGHNDWNISRTAQLLGIERTNLHKRIKTLGLERDDE